MFMGNSELVSYAILSVNYNEKNNFLSNFEPFVLEIIKKTNPSQISKDDLKSGLKDEFGLEIPSSIIKIICRNLSDKGYLFTEKIYELSDRYVYKPDLEKIDSVNLISKSDSMVKDFNVLIESFRAFIINNFGDRENLDLSNEKLIGMVDFFVKENNVNLVLDTTFTNKYEKDYDNYLVANFVQHINESDPNNYATFLNIVKGNMLSESLYYNSSGNFEKKFTGSKFFFDTSFIMYAMGYSGPQRQMPCTELLNLLKVNQAELFCFERNITEVIGILTWSKHHLNSGKDSHNTITYFRENGINEEDIDLIISDLESSIENQLGIKISPDSDYDHEDYSNVIDYNGFLEFLSKNISYTKDISLDNDVEAVGSIMRLRKRKQPTNIEDCGAIFVTTNNTLAKKTKEYFLSQENIGIPPVLTDSVVTNLVWLKNPQLYPNLPSLKLIADCLAAINPSDRLWNKYIDKLELLTANNELIDKNKIVTLRYLPEAKKILMDKTMGDENAITEGTANEILVEIEKQRLTEIELVKEKERQKAQESIIEHKKENENLQKELKDRDSAYSNTLEIIRKRSNKRAATITFVIVFLICCLLGLLSFFTLELVELHKNIQIAISVSVTVLFPILGFISKFTGFDITLLIEKFQIHLSKFFFQKECSKLKININ